MSPKDSDKMDTFNLNVNIGEIKDMVEDRIYPIMESIFGIFGVDG